MKLIIDENLRQLCRKIVADYDTNGEASLIDSDDLYQAPNFCGGWQSEDRRFWFSFYAKDGGDYIFSFTLDEARLVASGGSIDPPLEYWKEAPGWP
jgi:hypothetical protein